MANVKQNSLTLQEAIILEVRNCADTNESFSVHDITTRIRKNTSNGEYSIPEVEVSGASFKYDIPHVRVKELFDEIRNDNLIDNLFVTRQFNGMYYEYVASITGNSTAPNNLSQLADSLKSSSKVVAGGVSPVSTNSLSQLADSLLSTTTPKKLPLKRNVSDKVVELRILVYLSNCSNRGYLRPTLKQIQSAIKRNSTTGWSCKKIHKFVTDNIGYNVRPNGIFSNSTVSL